MASLYVPFMKQIYVNISKAKVKVLSKELLRDVLGDDDYYIECNGRIVTDEEILVNGKHYYVRLRVLGGKGGFGSMLRSIGAQIEKTTNREACRDLSGRRMRDINNEKRLQEWAAKAAERERAKAERRRERRERMKAGATQHRFDDPQYEQQKASIAENLDDAIEEGLLRAGTSGSSSAAAETASSTASEATSRKRKQPAAKTVDNKKARQWLAVDVDVDVSSSSSSDESSDRDALCDMVTLSASTAVNQSDDSGAGCSYHNVSPPDMYASGASCSNHNVSPPATYHNVSEPASTAGAGVSESGGSDSTSSSSSCSPHTTSAAVADDINSHVSSSPSATVTEATAISGSVVEDTTTAVSVTGENLNLEDYSSAEDLEQVGLDVLKVALMCRGLKCGGTVQQRAQRLFSVKGLSDCDVPPSLLARPPRK